VDNELEVIRDQMEETRTSLADKLETLEAQVRDTVQSATEAVASTVENVKETVQETVGTVQETVSSTVESVKSTVDAVSDTVSTAAGKLDPRQYVESNPWAAVGAAVGVGFLGGLLVGGSSSSSSSHAAQQPRWTPAPPPPPSPAPPASSASPGGSSGLLDAAKGLLSSNGPFGDAISKIEGLAVGTLMGYLREMVSTSAPEMWKKDLAGVLDNITTKLGGKVIHHPDLKPSPKESDRPSEERNRTPGNGSSWEDERRYAGRSSRSETHAAV